MDPNSFSGKSIGLKIIYDKECQVYTLRQPKYTIGRASTCDIQIKSYQVSRQQSTLFFSEETGEVIIVDGTEEHPSSNGTYVNGARIRECQVHVGDTIHFGSKSVKGSLDILPDLSQQDPIDAELRAFDQLMGVMGETPDRFATVTDILATELVSADSHPLKREANCATVLKILYNNTCQVYSLDQPKYLIGRANTCDIKIKSYQVSRQQATLFFSQETGRLILKDGDEHPSSNGTYVNGSRITECQIQVGDTIHFGSKLVKAYLEVKSDLEEQNQINSELKTLDELTQEETDSSATAISLPDSYLPDSDTTSVESLTLKISQLYYELDLMSSQLKQKEQSYLELKQSFEIYRRQVEQQSNHNSQEIKDLTALRQDYERECEQREALYRDLKSAFDRYQVQVEQEKNKTTQEIRELTWKLAAANKALQDYEKQCQTLIEDYKLYSQRVEQRLDIKYVQMQEDLIIDLLTVVDSFELAEKNGKPTTAEGKLIHQGYQGIYRLLLSVLDHVGVTRITTLNTPFDPVLHEAIGYQISDQVPENTILEERQAGYKIGSKVIRPAKVTVAGSE
jgi:molecular chaperone GrpE